MIVIAMTALCACEGANNELKESITGSESLCESLTEQKSTERLEETYEGETMYDESEILKNKYPELFELDCSKGLDVYVCQFASDLYYCHLFEHCDHESGVEYSELVEAYKSMRIYPEDMRVILASYDISPNDVHIIPWHHSASSYISQYFANVGMPEDLTDAYICNVRLMLLDDDYLSNEAYYSTYLCDIDSDGKTEICALGLGMTADVRTYTITAREAGATEPEYTSIIYHEGTDHMSIHNDIGVTGIRISGQDLNNKNKWHLLSVTFEDGKICVFEDGSELTK